MPTREILDTFWNDWDALTAEQRNAFLVAVRHFIEDLARGQGFRKGLRVKGVQGYPGVFEMTWAPDGRTTFQYGVSPHPGDTQSSGDVLARTLSSVSRNDDPCTPLLGSKLRVMSR